MEIPEKGIFNEMSILSEQADSRNRLAEALRRISEALRSGAEELDLSRLMLEDLPPELFDLSHLKKLKLRDNQLTFLPEDIGKLSNLTEIILNENPLTFLPQSFAELTQLSAIELVRCKFEKLPEVILGLPNLRKLNIAICPITSLPDKLFEKRLSSLWLFQCPIKEFNPSESFLRNLLSLSVKETAINDYNFLSKLDNIKRFSIGNKNLTHLPEEIFKLKSLRELYLGSCQDSKISDELGNLGNLTSLTITNIACKALPDSIGNLSNLDTLVIRDTLLEGLPSSIGSLSKLESLRLSNNNLLALPKEVGTLHALKRLTIGENGNLAFLPPELALLPNLKSISTYNNENLVSPPKSSVEKGFEAIIGYLKELLEEVQVWSSKLVVVGEGAAGKSSIIDSLEGLPFVKGKSTTHGLNLRRLCLEHPKETCEMTLNVWDFGGQDIYHATHQFYLTNYSLFLLVWSARTGYETGKIYKWLETINALAPNSPILIVATNSAPRGADLPKGDIENKYAGKVWFYEVDNETSLGIEVLKEAIRQQAGSLKYMGIGRPKTWIKSANAIKDCGKLYLSKGELIQLFQHKEVAPENYESLAGYLHDMGDILYYPDEDDLKDTIIVKPEWVSKQIAKVLDSEELSKSAGFLNKELLQSLWSDLDSNLHDKLITLMEKFDLSYKTKDDKEISLIVEKLKFEEPEKFPSKWAEFSGKREITFKYQLETIPAGIPTWFIARTHRFSVKIHWRYGALLQDSDGKHLALIIASPESRDVWLHVRGEMPYYFFAQLRDTLELTFARFKGLSRIALVPCPGHNGQKCVHMFELKHLEKKLLNDRPDKTIDCPEADELVDVMEMMFGLSFAPDNNILVEKITTKVISAIHEAANNQTLELKKFMSLEFLKTYQKVQEIQDATCPNIFTLIKHNSKFTKVKLSNQYEIQLYCQMPGCQHSVGKPYIIDIPKQWVKAISPYYSGMVKVLKLTLPLILPGAKEFLENVEIEDIEPFVESAKDYTEMLPESDEKDMLDKFNGDKLESEFSIRLIRRLLDKADPQKNWGGLNKIITPEGYILWLCPEHVKEYKN